MTIHNTAEKGDNSFKTIRLLRMRMNMRDS